MFNKPISEGGFLVWMALTISFMLINFSATFGTIYIALCFVWLAFLMFDKPPVSFPLERDPRTRGTEIIIGIAAYAVTLLLATLVQNAFNPASLPTGSVIDTIKLISKDIYQATDPVLKDSIILMILGWGFFLTIIETAVTAKIFERLWDGVRNHAWYVVIVLCAVVSSIFTLFHLSAKWGTSTGFIITFMFFAISTFIIWWRKSIIAAAVMHIANNSLAVALPYLGSITFTMLLPVIGIVAAIWLLPKLLNKQPIFG